MPIIVNHQHLIISIDSLSSPILSSTVACLSLNKPFQVIHSIMLFCLHIAYLTTNNRIADHSQQHIVTRNSLFITKNLLNNLKNPFWTIQILLYIPFEQPSYPLITSFWPSSVSSETPSIYISSSYKAFKSSYRQCKIRMCKFHSIAARTRLLEANRLLLMRLEE